MIFLKFPEILGKLRSGTSRVLESAFEIAVSISPNSVWLRASKTPYCRTKRSNSVLKYAAWACYVSEFLSISLTFLGKSLKFSETL